MKEKFCYPHCPFLDITEAQQNLFYKAYVYRPFHNCTKYRKRVMHSGCHPSLVRLKECDFIVKES